MVILRLCEGEPTSMRSVAAFAYYTYAQLTPPELQVTPKKESLKKGGGGNPCVCEQLNSRRTLTLPYPKFVALKLALVFLQSLLVVIRLLFRVYFCLFMFCFLYSLQLHFLVHSLKRKLMRMPKLAHSFLLSLPLVLSLSLSVGYRGSLALSARTCPLCPQQRQRRRTVFTFIVQLIRHLLLLSLLPFLLLLLLLLVC